MVINITLILSIITIIINLFTHIRKKRIDIKQTNSSSENSRPIIKTDDRASKIIVFYCRHFVDSPSEDKIQIFYG